MKIQISFKFQKIKSKIQINFEIRKKIISVFNENIEQF